MDEDHVPSKKSRPGKLQRLFRRNRKLSKASGNSGRDIKFKPDEDPTLNDTIFLRNVSRFDTTQESLKAHMEENFGPTEYCLLCKDRETDESKGTAFVKFKDPESAQKCLREFKDWELQTKFFLDGRNLFVLPALTRNQIGEVKQASAKIETNVMKKKKKFKKARHHRVPAQT